MPISRCAEWLAARRLRGESVADLPQYLRPATLASGYAVNAELAQLLAGARSSGPVGWKVGATTPKMQAYLGVPHPCAGIMLACDRHASPCALRRSDHVRLGLECEIAVEIGRPIEPEGPSNRELVAAAVARIYPACEIVDERYGDFAAFGTPSLVADGFFHTGFVLGEAVDDWRRIDLRTCRGEIRVDGVAAASGRGADVLGHPLNSVAWLEGHLRQLGVSLAAGDIVMTGSLTLPILIDRPSDVDVDISGLGRVQIRVS